MDAPRVHVLVVGAGPSGLTIANVLAACGVAVAVIDRKQGPVRESRAAIVHTRTLELWDKLGLADVAVRRGLRTDHVEVYERGRRAASFALAGRGAEAQTPFPYALLLPQDETERLLIEGLAAHDVAVEWQTELLSLSPRADGARVTVRRDGAEHAFDVRWVVGADGAGSAVRHALELGFAGGTYELTGLLADVELDASAGSAPAPGTIQLSLTRGGFVGIALLPGGRFRLFGAVPPELAPRDASARVTHDSYGGIAPGQLERWLDEYFVVDARLRQVEWTALFRIHSRMAERFRVGHVFLVGDAAHIHSPAGGQGMNLAIGDAYNLGWKLAAVVNGAAYPQLLDSYEAERIPIARTVLRYADRGFALEATDNPVAEWLRANLATRLIGPLSRVPAVQSLIFRLFSQIWIDYRHSPAVAEPVAGTGGPLPGDRAPEAVLHGSDDDARTVFDLLRGTAHHVLLFEGLAGDPALDAVRATVDQLLDRYALQCRVHVIPTRAHEAQQRYGARRPRVVLVRPDGHVAFAGPVGELGRLAGLLDRQFRSRVGVPRGRSRRRRL